MAVTEVQKAYLAGLIDGEGCVELAFNYSKTKYKQYYPRVRVKITNREVLEVAQMLYGGHIITPKLFNDNWKQSYDWIISCGKALTFLEDIFPYAIIKKDEISLLLTFKKMNTGRASLSIEEVLKREFIHNELKRLKSL